MASIGIHTTGSQFYIDVNTASHLNGRCVVFGRIIEGDEVLKEIEKVFTVRSTPVRDIIIHDCGYLDVKIVEKSTEKMSVNASI